LLVRLPGVDVPGRVALKGALVVSVGFEILKIVGAYTIKRSAASPTAGPFASIVAVLIWIQLVARWMLFSPGGPSAGAVGASVFAAGAAVGATVVTWVFTRAGAPWRERVLRRRRGGTRP
jgi:membrane protein